MKGNDKKGFIDELSKSGKATELELAIATAWFLGESIPGSTVTVEEISDFLEAYKIRTNINRYRLQRKLTGSTAVSAPKGKPVIVKAKKRHELEQKFSAYLTPPPPEIEDTILVQADFQSSRTYIRALVTQINGSYQFGFYDGAAVLMRRLIEVLIIDAFDRVGEDARIREGSGHLVMMNGLVNALKSGIPFKLSRNAPVYLESIKGLGDSAAHSRNYITKKKDLDDFAQKYRMLVEECRGLGKA